MDLFARTCPIRYIITVYALKEGWDCSYAYILCSLAEMGSSRAVEQILGRILRLPGAKRKTQDPLNWAYAFVASPKFLEAANSLKDALIENGFQKMEAIDFIKPFEQVPISIRGPLFEQVSRSPDFSKLPPILQKTVTYEQSTGRLVLGGDLSFREKQALIKSYDLPEDKAAVERLYQAVQGARVEKDPPLATKDAFQVPLMAVRFGDQVELFEENHFLDVPWNLAELNPSLSEEEFPSKKLSGATGQVDVDDKDTSFWLQTASDRFYPDFLSLLEDDRVLALEYKGEHLWSNDDSKEKRAVGELWAERSKGKCLFVMTRGKNWSMITNSIIR